MTKNNRKKAQAILRKKSLFLGTNGIVALAVFIFQCIQFFKLENYKNEFGSPWILLQLVPLVIGVLLIIFAILNNKQNFKITNCLNRISKARVMIAIIFLSFMILSLYAMRLFVNPDVQLINLGMSGIGLLMYSLALVIILFTVFDKSKKDNFSKDRFLHVSLLIILLLWLVMAISKFGLEPDFAFWNVAGVPGMWISLAGILLALILLNQFKLWFQKQNKIILSDKAKIAIEVAIVCVIWLSASLLWIKAPYSNSYFITDPMPPDGHYWPKSDARLMDLGGQYLIIGGKLETPYFTEKPFYALFLGLLHYFFGQSYQTITNIQIVVLALIPVFLYLLGKELRDRYLGFALAIYAIIKEITALYSTYLISLSNSRLMMTELPSALLLLIIAYVLVKWLENKENDKVLILIAGLTMGIAIFIRSNFLIVFLVLLLFLFFNGIRNLNHRLPQIGIFLTGVLVVILPWLIYNQVTYGKDPLTWKVQAAIQTRFSVSETGDRDESPKKLETPEESVMPTPTVVTPTLIPTDDQSGVLMDPTITATSRKTAGTWAKGIKPQSLIRDTNGPQIEAINQTLETGFYKSSTSKVLGHFLNNHVKALFVLPFQVYPADLSTILEGNYWNEVNPWNGDLPAESTIAFAVNILLISLGLTFAWRKHGWSGLVPFILLMAYYLSNALVRTSGGRYLVPADWVVYTYFFIGVLEIFQAKKMLLPTEIKKKPVRLVKQRMFWIVLGIAILVGLSLPILNLSFPQKYHNENNAQVLNRLPYKKIQDEIGIPPEELQAFSEKPDNLILYGREIYPSYQDADQNFNEKAITFTLLTPDLHNIVLPFGSVESEKLPAGEDMIAVGCKDSKTNSIRTYLVYFVQTDKLLWSNTTTFKEICAPEK